MQENTSPAKLKSRVLPKLIPEGGVLPAERCSRLSVPATVWLRRFLPCNCRILYGTLGDDSILVRIPCISFAARLFLRALPGLIHALPGEHGRPGPGCRARPRHAMCGGPGRVRLLSVRVTYPRWAARRTIPDMAPGGVLVMMGQGLGLPAASPYRSDAARRQRAEAQSQFPARTCGGSRRSSPRARRSLPCGRRKAARARSRRRPAPRPAA